ncbi:hypothetical protein AB0395_35115 [Streptosporangium sp. NPDC051023]|uniref:hypothetical protein n=1 Tax=Streptosporangium sp. NPDC051023 TaxID=3155410 RepID=UPI00344B6309
MEVSTILLLQIKEGRNKGGVTLQINDWDVSGGLDKEALQEQAIQATLNTREYRTLGYAREHVEVKGFFVTTRFHQL